MNLLHYGKNEYWEYNAPPVVANIDLPDSLYIYPMVGNDSTCTLMTLTNLAEPDWFQISCLTPILGEFLCVKFTNNSAPHYNLNKTMSAKFCTQKSISFNNTCYNFLWQKPVHLQQCIEFFEGFVLTNTVVKFLKQLIDYVSIERAFPLFFLYFKSNRIVVLKLKKYNNLPIFEMYTFSEIIEVFQICQSRKRQFFKSTMTFACTSGGFINSEYVCDG